MTLSILVSGRCQAVTYGIEDYASCLLQQYVLLTSVLVLLYSMACLSHSRLRCRVIKFVVTFDVYGPYSANLKLFKRIIIIQFRVTLFLNPEGFQIIL